MLLILMTTCEQPGDIQKHSNQTCIVTSLLSLVACKRTLYTNDEVQNAAPHAVMVLKHEVRW